MVILVNSFLFYSEVCVSGTVLVERLQLDIRELLESHDVEENNGQFVLWFG
jgi:hypothetical protein